MSNKRKTEAIPKDWCVNRERIDKLIKAVESESQVDEFPISYVMSILCPYFVVEMKKIINDHHTQGYIQGREASKNDSKRN